jgi:hypothetical protein
MIDRFEGGGRDVAVPSESQDNDGNPEDKIQGPVSGARKPHIMARRVFSGALRKTNLANLLAANRSRE